MTKLYNRCLCLSLYIALFCVSYCAILLLGGAIPGVICQVLHHILYFGPTDHFGVRK